MNGKLWLLFCSTVFLSLNAGFFIRFSDVDIYFYRVCSHCRLSRARRGDSRYLCEFFHFCAGSLCYFLSLDEFWCADVIVRILSVSSMASRRPCFFVLYVRPGMHGVCVFRRGDTNAVSLVLVAC